MLINADRLLRQHGPSLILDLGYCLGIHPQCPAVLQSLLLVRCEKYVQRTAPDSSIATFVRYEMQSWENAMAEEMHPLAIYNCQVVLDAVQSVFEVPHKLICEDFLGVTARRECVFGIEISGTKDEVRFDIGFCKRLLV